MGTKREPNENNKPLFLQYFSGDLPHGMRRFNDTGINDRQ
jgi:hypothetical protein